MSISNVFFTNKGKILHAKSMTGKLLKFTRLAIGNGETNGQAIQELDSLINERLNIPITRLIDLEDGTVKIGGTFDNNNLTSGFYYREIGLFAEDPDTNNEVLYCYGNAGSLAEYIAAQGSEIIEKRIDIIAIVSDATNVSAVINNSLVFVSQEDLRVQFEDHNNDESAHEPLRMWVMSLFGTGDWAKYSQAEDIQGSIGKSSDDSSKSTLFGFLGTIKSKIDSFVASYTSARALKLDNLDITVSSRAPSNTALSNETWTNARAATLDNIGTTGNTGGSPTTGTVMAKLNAILTWFTGTWTAARAAKLDNIESKVGQGDIVGKKMLYENISVFVAKRTSVVFKSYSNSNGGMFRLMKLGDSTTSFLLTIIVDGTPLMQNREIGATSQKFYSLLSGDIFFDIPFKASVVIEIANDNGTDYTYQGDIFYYINQ